MLLGLWVRDAALRVRHLLGLLLMQVSLLLLLLKHLELLLDRHLELELLLVAARVVCTARLLVMTADEGVVVAGGSPVVVQSVAEEDRRVRQIVRDGRDELLRLVPSDAARAPVSQRAANLRDLVVVALVTAPTDPLAPRARPILHHASYHVAYSLPVLVALSQLMLVQEGLGWHVGVVGDGCQTRGRLGRAPGVCRRARGSRDGRGTRCSFSVRPD